MQNVHSLEPSLKPTVYAVLVAHALLILILTTQLFFPTQAPKRKALVVQSVTLSPAVRESKSPQVALAPPAPPKPAPIAPPKPIAEEIPEPIVEEPEPEVVAAEVSQETAEEPAPPPPPPKKASTKPAKVKEVPKKTESKPKKEESKAKPKETTAKKKTTEKKTTEKTTAPESKTPAKKTPSKEALAALAKAQENLSKVSHKTPIVGKGSSSTIIPAAPTLVGLSSIQALGADGNALPPSEIGYQDELVTRLRMLLRLPDIGDVKVKLTVERSGKVLSASVTRSDSDENRRYVEKTLPTLKLPGFGKYFANDSQRTFQLVLSNDL